MADESPAARTIEAEPVRGYSRLLISIKWMVGMVLAGMVTAAAIATAVVRFLG